MSKLFQIYEEDLAELEKILPELAEVLVANLTGRTRIKLRRCQAILSNVRWNYGPPTDVETHPASDADAA